MTDEPDDKAGKREVTMMSRWLIAGAVVVLLLGTVFAVTVWPTLYRYEVKHRCVFEIAAAPFENEYSGQSKPLAKRGSSEFDFEEFLWRMRKDAKPWMRFVRPKITDDQYKIHRFTGEMYKLEKGRWVLRGILFDNPQELADSNGKAPNGCRRSSEIIEQHSYSEDGPWEEFDKKGEVK